jgi:hypothetical protein
METIRLRKMQQQPSDVERLLEAYIFGSGLLPSDAHQIPESADVPRELRKILVRATETGRAWSCRAHKFRTWLFTAEMSLELSRERGAPVLQVSHFGDGGTIEASGCWVADQKGKWHRCAD